jgi:hypothetical protein
MAMLQLNLAGENVKRPLEIPTGKPVTNPVVVALDTSIFVAHKGCTVEIPSLTEERT